MNFDNFVEEAKKDGVQKITTGAIVMDGNKILIVKRADDDFMGGLFELPGGGVDEGEALDAALIREVREELGLVVKRIIRFVDSFEYKSSSGKRTRQFSFVVEVENTDVTLSPEHTEFSWIKKEDIDKYNITESTKNTILNAWKQ